MARQTTREVSESEKRVREAFEGRRIQEFINYYRVRYNMTLKVQYKGEQLIFHAPMHYFQIDIDVLGVDFHWTFSITELHPEHSHQYEEIIYYQLRQIFERIPIEIVQKPISPTQNDGEDI